MREATQFEDRLLPGPCILAVVAGFMFTTPIYQTITDTGVGVIAMLTMEDIKFQNPLYPGDTLRSELEITDAHLTSKEDRGILKIKDRAYKHTGEVICEMTRVFLVQDADTRIP
jgi:2-methylfumaryl-CoA hydratase